MAIGYRSNGIDFDDIFEPRTTAKRADVGYEYTGIDISNRYEKASSGVPAGNTGYKSSGTDLGQLFAAKGGVQYWDGTVADVPSIISDSRGSGEAPGYSLAEILFFADGTVRTRNATTETTVGRWDGVVADSANTEVFFQVDSSTIAVNGNTNAWFQVNATRAASIESSNTSDSAFITVRLREIGDPSTEVSTTLQLSISYGGLE